MKFNFLFVAILVTLSSLALAIPIPGIILDLTNTEDIYRRDNSYFALDAREDLDDDDLEARDLAWPELALDIREGEDDNLFSRDFSDIIDVDAREYDAGDETILTRAAADQEEEGLSSRDSPDEHHCANRGCRGMVPNGGQCSKCNAYKPCKNGCGNYVFKKGTCPSCQNKALGDAKRAKDAEKKKKWF